MATRLEAERGRWCVGGGGQELCPPIFFTPSCRFGYNFDVKAYRSGVVAQIINRVGFALFCIGNVVMLLFGELNPKQARRSVIETDDQNISGSDEENGRRLNLKQYL